jgi:hypothetical protein
MIKGPAAFDGRRPGMAVASELTRKLRVDGGKMKRILGLLALSLSLAASAFAQAPMAEPRSIEAIVADIEQKQGVTAPDRIKIDKVDPALLGELGDAVMDVMIGSADMHDRMDRMLGGDGSPRLAAFHADLGEQYLRNGGLNGVRFGGPWGMGRFGMMYGWGRLGDQAASQNRTLEGKLGFIDDNPVLETKDVTYLLGFPNFYYYAYTDGIKKGAELKIEGYSFAAVSSGDKPYFAVSKATITARATTSAVSALGRREAAV